MWGRVIIFVILIALIVVLLVTLIRPQRRKRKPGAESHVLHDLLAAELLSGHGLSEEALGEIEPRVRENCSERVIELFMAFERECRGFHDGCASLYELAEAVRCDPYGPEAAQMPACAVKVAERKKGMDAAAMALAERCRWELRQERTALKPPVEKP